MSLKKVFGNTMRKGRPSSLSALTLSAALVGSVFAGSVFTGCGLVDAPETKSTSTSDVREYYYSLEKVDAHYEYQVVQESNGMTTKPDTLIMDMKGADNDWLGGKYDNTQVYECFWAFKNSGYAEDYYYSLSPEKAYYLGDEHNAETWVDMIAPVEAGKTWSFKSTQYPDPVIAKVTRFGFDAQIRGKAYSDVIEIVYENNEVKMTKWFARGVGAVYLKNVDKVQSSTREVKIMERRVPD